MYSHQCVSPSHLYLRQEIAGFHGYKKNIQPCVNKYSHQCLIYRVAIVTKCTLLKYIPRYKKVVAYSPDQRLKLLADVTCGFEIIDEVVTPSTLFWLVNSLSNLRVNLL